MRNINYFDKELSVEEYVKKEVCKNAGTQSVAFLHTPRQIILYQNN